MKFLVLLGLVAIGTNALRVAEQKHDGSSFDYKFDESKRGNQCDNDNHCDRDRECSPDGWFQERGAYNDYYDY